MAEEHSAAVQRGEQPGGGAEGSQAGVALVSEKGGAALAGGVDPASDEGQAVLGELVGAWATSVGATDTPEFRASLLANLETGTDRRAERYWQLLGIINGWPPIPSVVPAFECRATGARSDPVLSPEFNIRGGPVER